MKAAALGILVFVACVPPLVSIEGKACDVDHPCGAGFTCLSSNVCSATDGGAPGGSGGGSVGPVRVETQVGSAADAGRVSSAVLAPLASSTTQLFLASLATRPPMAAASLSGLGLSWTRLKTQCAARGTNGVEVWEAHGTGFIDGGVVTATFSPGPVNAVLAVTHYDRVGSSPVGNSVAANAQGPNGSCNSTALPANDPESWSMALPVAAHAIAYGAVGVRNAGVVLDGGFSLEALTYAGVAGDTAGIAVQTRPMPNATTVTLEGVFQNADKTDWAGIAVEIR